MSRADKLKLLQKMLAEKGIEKRQTIPERDPVSEPPLSYGQERMWFIQQLEPESSEYNDTLVVRLEGRPLDIDVLRRCVQEVVRRHEVLRTSFEQRRGVPYQRVLEDLEVPLGVVDLRGVEPAEQTSRLQALWQEQVREPFVLDRPPLLRVTLAVLGEDRFELGLTMHHIVSDGVAYTIFFRELGTLYEARERGEPSPLPPLPVQFADYAAWERGRITEEVIRQKLPFWQRYLGGDLPALSLPVDHPRQGSRRHHGAFLRFRFDDALLESLQELCRREKVTSNWVLLAAYFALWHRFSGQEDLVVGTPSSVRTRRELEDLIGFFVQTLILRLDVSGNPTFQELIARTRRTALEVSQYEDVPFDRIFQAVRPGRSAAKAPLLQAWIAPMKDLLEPVRLSGAASSYEIVDPKNARFDVALILDETPERLEGYWEYDTDLFERATIERIHQQMLALLRHVLRYPETRLQTLREVLRGVAQDQRTAEKERKRDARVEKLKKARRRKG